MYRTPRRSISRGRGRPISFNRLTTPGKGFERTLLTCPEETEWSAPTNLELPNMHNHLVFGEPPRNQHSETDVGGSDGAIPRMAPVSGNDMREPTFPTYHPMPQVMSVSVPRFYEGNASLWLLSLENIFRLKGIFSESQKYELALSALDLRHLERLEHVLYQVNSERPYTELKNEIRRIFSPSREKDIDELLYKLELGDRQPTELLFRMRKLLGEHDSPVLEKLFKDRLPDEVRRAIVAGPPCGLDELASRADRVVDENKHGRRSGRLYREVSFPSSSSVQEQLSNLSTSVSQLVEATNVSKVHNPYSMDQGQYQSVHLGRYAPGQERVFSSTPRSHPGGPTSFGHQTGRGFERPSNTSLCYYHSRFGERAYQCRDPCSWGKAHNNQTRAFNNGNRSESKGTRSYVGTLNAPHDNEPVFSDIDITGLIFVRDPETNVKFLVDTGSRLSILPCNRPDNDPRFSRWLCTADGTRIPAFEHVTLSVSLNLGKTFLWRFLRARVKFATLGLDFLTHHNVLVNPAKRTLQCEVNCTPIAKIGQSLDLGPSPEREFAQAKEKTKVGQIPRPFKSLKELLAHYTDVFELGNFLKPIRHETKMHIKTEGPPVCGRTRRLSPERLKILDRELQKLLDLGIVIPATSPFGSPLHMVPKKEPGEYRITGDYRALNKQTVPDRYAIPFLTDFTDFMSGSTVFSSLDLYKSYHQIEIAEEDVEKTTILTPRGSYAFKRVAMGLRNSGAVFQRFMNEVTRGLSFVYVYIDDILVFSHSLEEHFDHLTQLFERLLYYGLVVNEEKCHFCVNEISFLGYTVNDEGIRPNDSRVQTIREFSRPRTNKELKRYLGMLNFYRRHIPGAAEVLAPLNRMTSTKKGRKPVLEWNEETDKAFTESKELLARSTLLKFPLLGATTFLTVDASGNAVGGALQQAVNDEVRPIAFFSKALTPAETKYSAYDRELLAMYLSVKHFRYFLEGRAFHILSDQKPLCLAFARPPKDGTAKQLRHLNYISEFTTDVRYIRGADNVVADCLSRPNVNSIFETYPLIDFAAMVQAQEDDPEVNELVGAERSSLQVVMARLPGSDKHILGDVSQGKFRPIIPKSFRKEVFDVLHSLSHPGIKASQRLVGDRFVWPGMKKDVKEFVTCCHACQASKIQKHNRAPLQKFDLPSERFQHVHVDLVGKLPMSGGFSYLLTVVDRYTRHMECVPLADITAKSCANAFMLHWVARFGAPVTITSDRGGQFLSCLWEEMCEFLGAQRNATCSFRPESNGMVERMHRTLKTALRCQENPTDWYSNLGVVLLGMRAMVKEDLGCSSAELTLGTPLRVPGEFFVSDRETIPQTEYGRQLVGFMQTLRPSPPREPCRRDYFVDDKLSSCSHVFVKNNAAKTTLDQAYTGPYRVLSRTDKYFTLEMGANRYDNVTINRLKACSILMRLRDPPPELPGPVENDVEDNNRSDLLSPNFTHVIAPEIVGTPVSSQLEVGSPSLPLNEQYRTRYGRSTRLPVRYRRSLSA